MSQDLRTLRHQLKQRRAALSSWQRHLSAKQLTRHLCTHPIFRHAQHIALYWPIRGEANPTAIRNQQQPHQHVYLPTLNAKLNGQLTFVEWNAHTRWQYNRFGIQEPVIGITKALRPQQLDLVIMPLLGFDQYGNRLGMGGGFYDRSFAFLKHSPRRLKPLLVGYAYSFQNLGTLNPSPWDIPLDYVVTERGIQRFKPVKY